MKIIYIVNHEFHIVHLLIILAKFCGCHTKRKWEIHILLLLETTCCYQIYYVPNITLSSNISRVPLEYPQIYLHMEEKNLQIKGEWVDN